MLWVKGVLALLCKGMHYGPDPAELVLVALPQALVLMTKTGAFPGKAARVWAPVPSGRLFNASSARSSYQEFVFSRYLMSPNGLDVSAGFCLFPFK